MDWRLVLRRSRPGPALLLLALAGCGRIGYDPAVLTVVGNDGSAEVQDALTVDWPSDVGQPPGPPDGAQDQAPAKDTPAPAADAAVDSTSGDGQQEPPPRDMQMDLAPVVDAPAADSPPGDGPSADTTVLTCPAVAPQDWIAHFEDGTASVAMVGDRGGFLFTPIFGSVTAQSVRIAPVCGSQRAMSLRGAASSGAGRVVQGRFKAPGVDRYFDARAWDGIILRLRSGGAPLAVRIKLPDRNTIPGGDVCGACNDHFQIAVQASTEWTTAIFDFRTLTQLGGGDQFPTLDTGNLFAIEFAVSTPDAFEIFIDDVALFRLR